MAHLTIVYTNIRHTQKTTQKGKFIKSLIILMNLN